MSEEQPAWIDYESNSENKLTIHRSLKVDLDEATAKKIFAKRPNGGFKQFNQMKYFTDFLDDMFELLDNVSPKMKMRFVALFKFARLIAQFADGKPISDCLGYIKEIQPIRKKLILSIFSSPSMFKVKTLKWTNNGESGHFVTVAILIDENKVKLFDFLVNVECVYYDGIVEIMTAIL